MSVILERLKAAVDKWLEWTKVVTVDNGEPAVTYASPTQAMISKVIGFTLVATAIALQFMPNISPSVVHQVDELMRTAARL
jgi:hypothetical protein